MKPRRVSGSGQIVEVAVAQAIGAEDRHRERGVSLMAFTLSLSYPWIRSACPGPGPRTVLVLLHAPDRRSLCGVRSPAVAGTGSSSPGECGRRWCRATVRRRRATGPARGVHRLRSHGDTRARRAEDLLAVLGVAAGRTVGAGAESVRRYARPARCRRPGCAAAKAGISVSGTPRRMVLKRPSSVRPEAQTWVMSGPRTPRASIPWQSAQRERNSPSRYGWRRHSLRRGS